MPPLISTRKLRKAYPMGEETVWALDGIDIDIERGEFVAVMGPSGSGKSTFMNRLGCLDRATEGTIKLEDREVSKLGMRELAVIRNRHVGFVFQQFNLLPRTTAKDNVMLPLLYSDVPRSEWGKRAEQCLAQVGLTNRMHHHPSQLSGGQQQRVAIARALINNPLLIMADEPTGALDTRTGIEIMTLFQELNAQGKTIVLVTHEHDIAAFTARQLAFRDGKVRADERQSPARAADALRALH